MGCLQKGHKVPARSRLINVALPEEKVCWVPPPACAAVFVWGEKEYTGCTTADAVRGWCYHSYKPTKDARSAWSWCKPQPCCQVPTDSANVQFDSGSHKIPAVQGVSYPSVFG